MLYFIFILAARLKISSPIYRFITAPCQKKCIISAVKRSKINYIYTRLWAILECFQETVLLQNYISISENALSFLDRRFFWWSSKESLRILNRALQILGAEVWSKSLTFVQTLSILVKISNLKFRRDFEAKVWSVFCCWCLVEVTKWNLGQYSEARFGQDFYFRFSRDTDVWLRFWS